MKKLLVVCCICLTFSITAVLISCNSNEQAAVTSQSAKPELSQAELLSRGKYLVTAIGCNDCHSPKKMGATGPVTDSSKLLSGHEAGSPLPVINKAALQPGNWILFAGDLTAYVGPFGMSFSANLTPDSITGLGMWTEDVFVKAIRSGKHMGQEGGRPIMPPMPWEGLAVLNDDDLKSIFTFLKSIPPISNKVPAYVSPPEIAAMK